MAIGTVFENNRTQAVRLPADTRFPVGVKRVVVRVVGRERVLCPVENSWDSFFFGEKRYPMILWVSAISPSYRSGNPCSA